MSWSRQIAGGAVQGGPVRPSGITVTLHLNDQPAVPPTPIHDRSTDSLRQQARRLFVQGQAREALAEQRALIAAARETGDIHPDDWLFLAFVHYATGDIKAGIQALRDAGAAFPDEPAVQENLGVLLCASGRPADAIEACEAALRMGSDSPNVLDCLADTSNQIGRRDLAVDYGRRALVAKDQKFGGGPKLARVPDGPPPPFNPTNPAENVIAYCLWGNAPRYQVPLLENARVARHLFPSWTLRVYHDDTVDRSYLGMLVEHGVELRQMALPADLPEHRKLLWRFEVVADPTVRRFLCRDADSLLSVKERVAVDAWLASTRHFHTMRDWYTHTDLVLAGMWGGVGGILPPVATLLTAYAGWRMEFDHVDQDVLSEAVWPIIRDNILIHDSIFAPCLGSVPFPPFGALPVGLHIGQNAFLHFHRPE